MMTDGMMSGGVRTKQTSQKHQAESTGPTSMSVYKTPFFFVAFRIFDAGYGNELLSVMKSGNNRRLRNG